MDLDAWISLDETSEETKKAYSYFMRPEPQDVRSEVMIDDETGQRYRMMAVGPVRNMAKDTRPVHKVYLDPLPHLRIADAKPLQGWYKAKVEEAGVRNRPCFTDAVLTQPYGGYCAVGCAFSLVAGELIDTPQGLRPIDSLKVGDEVYGRTQEGRVVVPVEATTSHWKAEGYVVVELEDGRELKVTADHPVYSALRGWVAAGDLLPNEDLEGIDESEALSGLPQAYSVRAESLRQLFARRAFLQRQQEQNSSGQASLQGLRYRDPQSSPFMRFLFGCGALAQWLSQQGQTFFAEGATQVGGHPKAYERARSSESGQHVSSSLGAEIPRVQSPDSRARSLWEAGVQAIEAFVFHRPAGTHLSHAFAMGGMDGYVAGQSGLLMGVRTGSTPSAQWGSVSPRLQTFRREMAGGEGLLLSPRPAEGSGSASLRASNLPVGRESSAKTRCVRVRTVPGGLTVYDIQTSTRNFYQRGVLVHNCYINSGVRGYRGSGLITVPMDYGEQVSTQLNKMKTSAAGYFSSFTDPFLPLEDVYHNTQRGIQAFTNRGLPVFILSRKPYPQWAMDALMLNPHSYAQKSINTWDESIWRRLSPGAATLAKHMEDIRELRSRGVYVSIQLNPVVPGIVNHNDVEKTIEMLAEAGANHVIVKFVEASFNWAGAMKDRIRQRFERIKPEGVEEFARLFVDNIGGQRTIVEDYRMEGHRRYQKKATECGVTYSVCYEYEYERNPLGKILNKTGISVAPKFTTSEQCHGHRVPMYSRKSLADPFQEVEDCPPTGCLYCGDSSGKGKCGSELFGAAPALRSQDFKFSVWDNAPAPKKPVSLPPAEEVEGDESVLNMFAGDAE